jgi:Transposase
VVGIDLGEDRQAACLVDHDVRVLWRRTARVKAHELGAVLDEAVAAAGARGLSRVTVACEPTGPRWMQVQRLCAERGLALVCIQPLVSHIAREQEDYTAHKRDEPDAVLIARLAAELHCYVPEQLDEQWAYLRGLGRRREQLVRTSTASVLRIRDLLSVAWPSVAAAAAQPFASATWLAALEVVTSRCGADPARLADDCLDEGGARGGEEVIEERVRLPLSLDLLLQLADALRGGFLDGADLATQLRDAGQLVLGPPGPAASLGIREEQVRSQPGQHSLDEVGHQFG